LTRYEYYIIAIIKIQNMGSGRHDGYYKERAKGKIKKRIVAGQHTGAADG